MWLYLLTLVVPAMFKVGPIVLMPTRLLLMIVIVPMTANLLAGKYGKLLAVDIFFFLHMAWATVAIAVNNPDRVIENAGSTTIEFLGGYLMGRAYIRTPQQLQKLAIGLLIMNALLLPFSIPETLNGVAIIPKFLASLPGVTSVKQVTYERRMGLERVQNAFAHPIHYGLFCSVCLSLVFIGLKDRLTFAMRFVGTGIVFMGVFLSLSSGALLSAILQMGLFSWAFIFRNVRRKWLMLLGLFALMYVTIDLLSNRTPSKVLMSYATFSAQTAYYRSIINDWGMRNVWANPIYGLGLRDWVKPSFMTTTSVDDFWLVIAMRYGIPGFLLLAIGYGLGLVKIGLRDFGSNELLNRLRLVWMITFAGLSFTLVTVHVWTAIYTFVFFLFGAGMWMADYDVATEEKTSGPAAPGDGGRRLRYSRQTAPPAPATPSGPAQPTGANPYSRFAGKPGPDRPRPGPGARPRNRGGPR
ncbi:MAG: O-antigen ligase family protein [Proteobacteria bacterium]|nr:O-antigen ligase family protein [Pseudomonadota bacterium]